MPTQFDRNTQRQTAVRAIKGANGRSILNGIDYIEVAADLRTLNLYFIHNLPGTNQPVPFGAPALSADNILIEGGTRIQSIQAEFAAAIDNLLTVRVNTPGDFSVYTLRLVDTNDAHQPPEGFDSQLARVEFVFRTEALTNLNQQGDRAIATAAQAPPPIDYLTKDYASFRQLMLNRLAITTPQWQERNPADLGIMLVELLAYTADHLSYYQDAVATESYLGTARKRVSVCRHARLLDYFVHNGRNARTWITIAIDADADGTTLLGASIALNRPGTQFLTRIGSQSDLSPMDYETVFNSRSQCFEAMHDLTLYSAQNEIEIYPWGSQHYCLPKGATQATLKDTGGQLRQQLQPGIVLIFEQVRGRQTGKLEDADPTRRYAVRLTRVRATLDPLQQEGAITQTEPVANPQNLVTIEWHRADALPAEFWVTQASDRKTIENISVVRGNVMLADHGRTLLLEPLDEVTESARYCPRLKYEPLTYQAPSGFGDVELVSATELLQQVHLHNLQPSIQLQEVENADRRWQPRTDLLSSDRFARDFVVEMEEDGRAYLRFGDNQLGRQPTPKTQFQATYRVGNGSAGNVGAEAIVHLYPPQRGIRAVRNPLPARGGAEPESLDHVRFQAPQAFRERQCAVTEADYAQFAQRFPGVQRAVATRRWTGSWETIFITVDRTNGQGVDASFRRNLLAYLEQFRLAAHTLEIDNPRFVPLDLALTVQVKPDYFRRSVQLLLQETFSDRVQTNGQLGFFHPELQTFAQPIYLSEIVKTAMQVAGVLSVQVTRFQRLWQLPQGELETGKLVFDRLEIPVLRNDPSAPEGGRIAFDLKGGLAYE
ncbi:MAG: putative baseplate assembly protein [Leptolyngbyaceae cyanobacterium CSU_1_3]|nr:putative baseplate assembly protein [Leptolyngbyaceae cyanobacterium CSU_1_3]